MQRRLKILVCHNYYHQRGGEDISAEKEIDMLRSYGHDVITYTRNNDEIKNYHFYQKALLFFNTAWQKKAFRDISDLIRKNQPDISHFQNIFPLISPAGYYAAGEAGIPVVQTIRNFRMICPGALLLKEGNVCEACIKGDYSEALRHRCYRNSRIQTQAVVRMLKYHHRKRTFENKVNVFIALTHFVREKYIAGGFDRNKIVIKPNFISRIENTCEGGDYAVYAGRLSPEKGVAILMEAWKKVDFPIKVIGDGPLMNRMRENKPENMELTGYLDQKQMIEVMKKARFLVFPSIWYETFGRTIIEAFACGKPVVVSSHGVGGETVKDGITGLHFHNGDARDLALKANVLAGDKDLSIRMGRNALLVFEEKYTMEENYRTLIDIYDRVLKTASGKSL